MKFTIPVLITTIATIPTLAESFSFGPGALKFSSTSTLPNQSSTRVSAVGGPSGGRAGGSMPDNFSLSPDEYKAFTRFGEDMLKQAFPKMTEQDMKAVSTFGNELFKPVLRNYAPGYEVIDNDEKFQVQVDVPGVQADNLNISLEDDDKVLTLSGSRKKLRGGQSYLCDFSESFQLDPAVVDTTKLSADLQNGVLIVSAPKIVKVVVETSSKKSIPITQTGRSTTESVSN